MTNKKRLYIAYGSNINLPQMARRCPTAKPVGTAVIRNYEMLFRGGRRGGVATVEPKEGASVPVLVWAIRPKDEAALDHYEGYPNLYGKRMMDVELNGKAVSAMVYVMTPGHELSVPSSCYYDVIAEGYRTAGFDSRILDNAVVQTYELIKQEIRNRRIHAEKAWKGFIGEMTQGQRGDVPRALRDELDRESLTRLGRFLTETRKDLMLEHDAREFVENALINYPGDIQSLGVEHIGHILGLYTEHRLGELEWGELSDQCREYLSGLDDSAPEQCNLFGMKWGW